MSQAIYTQRVTPGLPGVNKYAHYFKADGHAYSLSNASLETRIGELHPQAVRSNVTVPTGNTMVLYDRLSFTGRLTIAGTGRLRIL